MTIDLAPVEHSGVGQRVDTLPKISVVVPSFNQAKWLEATLLSILDQNYPNLELVVIDGGSTDGSVEIIRRYQEHMRFWCSEPDGGQVPGIQKGFSHCTGEILCFLNSDDLFQPGALLEVGKYFSQHPQVDAVYGDTLWINPEGKPLRKQVEMRFIRFIWLYTYNYVPGMSMFWRRSLYDRVGGFDDTFNVGFDTDLWARFSDHVKIYHVRRQWSCMRFYPDQKSRRLLDQAERENMRIRARYWKNGVTPRTYLLRRKIAISIRILWRLAIGGYYLGYRRHMRDL